MIIFDLFMFLFYVILGYSLGVYTTNRKKLSRVQNLVNESEALIKELQEMHIKFKEKSE